MSTVLDKGYRTFGIDTQIPWPAKEQVITFRGREFYLLPGSDKVARMIRVKTATGFTQADADKAILEMLSALAWAEQGSAMTTYGNWCTAPLNVGKEPVGIGGNGHFDYLPDPAELKAKLALALYREGLSVNLTPYKFLSFFKVINTIRNGPKNQMEWINANLQHVTDSDAIKRISAIQSTSKDVANYLYGSGRCAIAHAFDQNTVVNPDDPADLSRLHEDLSVMRELARIVIERTFKVKSAADFHDEHLYELEGFRVLLGSALAGRIKVGEEIPLADVPFPKKLAVRMRDRDHIELFDSMDATVVYVRDGCVRIRLGSGCNRLAVFVTLDFGRERLVADPLADVQYKDDGTPDAAKMILQWLQMYRWWFGGNGVVEVWDIEVDKLMARAQPYLPPVNSWFPHGAFDKMVSELRARIGILEPPNAALPT